MRGRAVGGARGVVDEGALPVNGGVFVSELPLEGVPELCTRVCWRLCAPRGCVSSATPVLAMTGMDAEKAAAVRSQGAR